MEEVRIPRGPDWASVPRQGEAKREHGLVLVFGETQTRERVRSKLADFGIACASARDPASVTLEHGARTLGWVLVGVDAVRVPAAEPPPWCIFLGSERGNSALAFVWPDEALPFVCTVLALGDRAHARHPADVALEQRVWFAIHHAFEATTSLRLDVHDGVVTVAGLDGAPFQRARACALAREVAGVKAVEVVES